MSSQQKSLTLASDFIDLVRSDYNDSTSTYFSDADMLRYINDGTLDIAIKSQCLQTVEQKALLADTIEYSISAQYIEVIAAHYIDSSGKSWALKPGSIDRVGLDIAEGDTDAPAYWYEFNGKVGIYPALASVTTQAADVFLASRPSVITAADTILIPEVYDVALKKYVLSRMALKDKNSAMHTSLMGEYNAEIMFYRNDQKGA